MYWRQIGDRWILRKKKTLFEIKQTGKLYWVIAQHKGNCIPVCKKAWGYDLIEVRAKSLQLIGEWSIESLQ